MPHYFSRSVNKFHAVNSWNAFLTQKSFDIASEICILKTLALIPIMDSTCAHYSDVYDFDVFYWRASIWFASYPSHFIYHRPSWNSLLCFFFYLHNCLNSCILAPNIKICCWKCCFVEIVSGFQILNPNRTLNQRVWVGLKFENSCWIWMFLRIKLFRVLI